MLKYSLIQRIRLYLSDLRTKATYHLLRTIVALFFITLLAEQQIIPSELVADEEIELSEVLEEEVEDKEVDLFSLFLSHVNQLSIQEQNLCSSTPLELSSFWEDVHLNQQNPPPQV